MADDPFKTTVLDQERPDHGLFIIRRERWEPPGNPSIELRVLRTQDGDYIGSADDDHGLTKFFLKHEIVPELKRPDSKVCSVGQSRKDGRWWGWSHRAIYHFPTRDGAVKFADEVATAKAPAFQSFSTREEAAAFVEEADVVYADYSALYLDERQEQIIKYILQRARIPVNTQKLHVSLFQSYDPGFKIVPELKRVEVKTFFLAPWNGTQLALLITDASIAARQRKIYDRFVTFGQKHGFSVGPNKYVAHLTVSTSPGAVIHDAEQIKTIGSAIKTALQGKLVFTGERVNNQSPVAPSRVPPRIATPQSNKTRLDKKKPKRPDDNKETSSMRVPARIVPRRKVQDPLAMPCADFQQKLADLYERRKIAALVGQARTVQILNANIRQLRNANGLEEDPTTRPLYVGHDSNIDPRGGMLTEQSKQRETAARHLRGHRKIMDALLNLHGEPAPSPTLNVNYDLDWSKGHTMRGMASVFKLLSAHGYVARKMCPEPDVHAYEFSNPDCSDVWTFTCCSGADWCFEVRHNGKLLGGTFTMRPGAPVEEQGIPESMMKDGWEGRFDPLEAQRYTMAWRNVLSMIRAHVEKIRPSTVNLRGA